MKSKNYSVLYTKPVGFLGRKPYTITVQAIDDMSAGEAVIKAIPGAVIKAVDQL